MQGTSRLYELRTYHAAAGKLEALLGRFRKDTVRLFKQYGMQLEGFWVPLENEGNTLVYLLSFADKAALEHAWGAFKQDAEWIAIKAESNKDGDLVDRIDSVLWDPTDFSPVR